MSAPPVIQGFECYECDAHNCTEAAQSGATVRIGAVHVDIYLCSEHAAAADFLP